MISATPTCIRYARVTLWRARQHRRVAAAAVTSKPAVAAGTSILGAADADALGTHLAHYSHLPADAISHVAKLVLAFAATMLASTM